MEFSDQKLFSDINGLDESEIAEVIISQIIKLSPEAVDRFDKKQHIILKEFVNATIKPEFRAIQLQQLNSVYYHTPLDQYDVNIPDLQLKTSLKLKPNWHQEINFRHSTYETFRLSRAPGCSHKSTGCNVICPQCQNSYTCRYCHDEVEDHVLDIKDITQIQCKNCKAKQEFSDSCIYCQYQFGISSCYQCKIQQFNDVNRAPLIHCDKCGKCYGCLEGQIHHCDVCQFCIDSDSFKRHVHGEVCLVCYEQFLNSSLAITVQNCGHIIHALCFRNLRSNGNNKCIICRRLNYQEGEKDIYNNLLKISYVRTSMQNINDIVSCQCYQCSDQFNTYENDYFYCEKCDYFDCQRISKGDYKESILSQKQLFLMFINVYFEKEYKSFNKFCIDNDLIEQNLDNMKIQAIIIAAPFSKPDRLSITSFVQLIQ
ncbi:CHY zinc finger domain-containing protein [Spironucleus salmonicida]|uniref:CHY zinc finger domain-containing protein n=1 Tax=Spironucleus salmonicida TaxID=348837 RepID=V6LX15_9EUKA|nr:CHY zinc finger domain-containing protein [Spironucleus salmonicida]|eukprot:EST48251.1 CHY zinc finger domain-containing protein [Spironucleus salmonicida]